jgi:hypothetical protein
MGESLRIITWAPIVVEVLNMKNFKLLTGLAAISVASVATLGGVSIAMNSQPEAVKANYTVTVSAALSPSVNTGRYWIVNNASSWWSGNPKMGIHAWGGTTNAYYLMTGYANTSGGQTFFYADIPADTTTIQLCRFNSSAVVGSSQEIWNDSSDFSISSYPFDRCHWTASDSGAQVTYLSNGIANNPRPSAYLLSAVLSAYLTCSNSSVNGYAAAANLFTYWYTNYDSSLNGTVETVKISDYAYADYVANGSSYSSGMSKSASISVKEKWEGLCAAANISPTTGASLSALNLSMTNSNSTQWGIVGACAIGFIGLSVGFFLFSRRKHVA